MTKVPSERSAIVFAGGHLLLENGVKKQLLSEPQASSADLAIESSQVVENSGADAFVTFAVKQK